jgi:hypothetical protein
MRIPLLLLPGFFCVISVLTPVRAGERITVAGTDYPNAEVTDVSRDGVIYKVENGTFVTLPWADTTAAQLSAVRAKFPGAMENALYDAHYVKGSVFQVNADGVVIQIDLDEGDTGPEFKNGARVLTNGLVIVKDLPTNIPQGEGAPIEITAHKRQTYTYDMGIAAKEIPLLTMAKPLWGQEQEWKNTEGQSIYAKLVAVKGDKVMFEKGGKRFVYDLANLDDEGRKRAAEIAEKLAGFPLP